MVKNQHFQNLIFIVFSSILWLVSSYILLICIINEKYITWKLKIYVRAPYASNGLIEWNPKQLLSQTSSYFFPSGLIVSSFSWVCISLHSSIVSSSNSFNSLPDKFSPYLVFSPAELRMSCNTLFRRRTKASYKRWILISAPWNIFKEVVSLFDTISWN